MTNTNKMYVVSLLKQVREIHADHAEGHYELAQIFGSIKAGKLHSLIEYKSLKEMVLGEDLPLSSSQAARYANIWDHAGYLGYSKVELVALFKQHSVGNIYKVICTLDEKISAMDFREAVAQYYERWPQYNFQVDEPTSKIVERVLRKYGMKLENGRRVLSSEAFALAMRDFDKVSKKIA